MDKDKLISIFNLLSKAGEAIMEIYTSNDFDTQVKADNTPLTLADKKSSDIINSGLEQLFPTIPIINEETNIPEYKIRKNWINYFLVDPLDGTKEFINKNGEFCINLALIKNNVPQEGWIYQPLKKLGWYCKKGEGIVEFSAHQQLKAIAPSSQKNASIRIGTSRSFFKPLEARIIEEFKTTYPVAILHRGSSLKQIDIVQGRSDMYLKAGPCSEWDTAPGQLMVEEMGGIVLRQDNFETMQYNKPNLQNPHFVMLNAQLNTPEFIDFLKKIIKACN